MLKSRKPEFGIPELDELRLLLAARAEADAARRVPRRRARRWAPLVAAAAMLLVAIAVAAGAGVFGGPANVQDALADVANRIESAPRPAPGEFVYTRSRTQILGAMPAGIDWLGRPIGAFLESTPTQNESWLSITKRGTLLWHYSPPVYPTPGDAARGKRFADAYATHARWERNRPRYRKQLRAANARRDAYFRKVGEYGQQSPAGLDTKDSVGVFDPRDKVMIGSEQLTPRQLAAYPRDPRAVYARIKAGAERDLTRQRAAARRFKLPRAGIPSLGYSIWQALNNPVGTQSQPVPYDLRAAMVRALAYLPGVQAIGERADSLGRTGDAFALDHDGMREEVIFDRDTAVTLSASTTALEPAKLWPSELRRVAPGTKLSEYLLLEQKTVAGAPSAKKLLRKYRRSQG